MEKNPTDANKMNEIPSINSHTPLILNGKYFKLVYENNNLNPDIEINADNDKQVEAICQLCLPQKKVYKGTLKINSNFVTNLKRVHTEAYNDYCECMKTSKHKKKKTKLEQTTLSPSGSILLNKDRKQYKTLTQERFENLIINYIVKGMHPLSTVEEEPFRELLQGCRANQLNIMSRRTLTSRLEVELTKFKRSLIDTFRNVQYLCLTADVWSSSKRSFLRMTAHWLDKTSLKRKSAAISCRRLKGTHSYDRIALEIQTITDEFDLDISKIIATVTDNGSNFVKAFKEFGINVNWNEYNMDSEETENLVNEDISDDIVFHGINPNEENEINLSHHIRCAAHTLNLVGTTDCAKALKDKTFSRIHHSSMGKLQALWNAAGRPKSYEQIFNIIGCSLKRPCATRWNSLFDSLDHIIKINNKGQLEKLLDNLKIPRLNNLEKAFLAEYHKILEPLALAIDHIQSQNNFYYAALVPTLFSLKEKLQKISENNVPNCRILLHHVKEGVTRRFDDIFQYNLKASYALLATMSHPYYKLRWIPLHEKTQDIVKHLQNMLITEATKLMKNQSTDNVNTQNFLGINENPQNLRNEAAEPAENSFYEFEDVEVETNNMLESQHVELEVLNFLQNPCKDLVLLEKYTAVRNVFYKYNSILPSSAPVERLFSFAGMILRPQRRRLSDTNFETLLMLKQTM